MWKVIRNNLAISLSVATRRSWSSQLLGGETPSFKKKEALFLDSLQTLFDITVTPCSPPTSSLLSTEISSSTTGARRSALLGTLLQRQLWRLNSPARRDTGSSHLLNPLSPLHPGQLLYLHHLVLPRDPLLTTRQTSLLLLSDSALVWYNTSSI